MNLKRLFWVGCFPVGSRSIGDNAQTLAIQKILDTQFSDYVIKRFTCEESNLFFKENVSSEDLIFLSSRGDFGDLYPNSWHNIRKQIIVAFPHTKIIQLPVTVHYESPASFEADKVFFSGKKNLTIMCRTFEGTELLHNNFDCNVLFFPDFVFSLKAPLNENSKKRKGCLVVLRGDCESVLTPNEAVAYRSKVSRFVPRSLRKQLYPLVSKLDKLVATYFIPKKIDKKLFFGNKISDVQISNQNITDNNREQIVMNCLQFYGNFEKVVSDRFHACVFAYLMKTPFIALVGRIPQKTTVYPFYDYPAWFVHFRDIVFNYTGSKPESVTPQNMLDLIKTRRSVRKWSGRHIEDLKINQILEAGAYAPSAANRQAVRLLPITNISTIQVCCKHSSPWFTSLPAVVFVVFYDTSLLPSEEWTRKFVLQDSSCTMMTMMLAAQCLGLKTCWATVNPVQEKKLHTYFKVPSNYKLTCMLFLGYSNINVSLESMHQGKKIKRNIKRMVLGS